MTKDLIEVNFDGLVGPTHHFGGLGVGNLASQESAGGTSDPRSAALQGIDKIQRVADEGNRLLVRQAVLPPPPRPDIDWLRHLGFDGDDAAVLCAAGDHSPHLLSAAWSASSMWTANAATVSPAADSADGMTHLTIANLLSSPHRSLEAGGTYELFRQVFSDAAIFRVHPPLSGGIALRDEGAANHMRLFGPNGRAGIELFVHGGESPRAGARFFPRQSLEACRAVARLHRLDPQRTFFLRQHPDAIEAGAFHNDVVATSYGNVLLHHQWAFVEAEETLQRVAAAYQSVTGRPLHRIEIPAARLSLDEAVASYLFNSQLIPRAADQWTLACPAQCRERDAPRRCVEEILDGGNPIDRVMYVDLRESMWNGGGPACLRLRVMMDEDGMSGVHGGVWWSDRRADQLRQCVERRYPDRVTTADLRSTEFAAEAQAAASAVRAILGL